MHEATLPEFYSVCLSYAPVPVCKDTLPWCCAGTADDQTPWSSDLELHNELKIYAANQRDRNLIRTSRTIRMRHDIDRQRSPFFHQSLRKGQPLAIEKVKSCKLTVQRRRDWDEERKKGLFFFCLSLSAWSFVLTPRGFAALPSYVFSNSRGSKELISCEKFWYLWTCYTTDLSSYRNSSSPYPLGIEATVQFELGGKDWFSLLPRPVFWVLNQQ